MDECSRDASFIERGDKCLTNPKCRKVISDMIIVRDREILARFPDRISIFCSEGTESMLYLQSELSEDT